MEPVEEKQANIKLFGADKRKLSLALAGCGALVLIMFVLMPMLTPTQAPEQPSTPQEIVQEVLGGPLAEAPEERQAEGLGQTLPVVEGMAEDAEAPGPDPGSSPGQAQGRGQAVIPVPSPLLTPRDDGGALPVAFPRQEPGTAEDLVEADEAEAAGDGLPPPLTPEEIEAALPEAPLPAEPARTADSPAFAEIHEGASPESFVQVAAAGDTDLQGRGGVLPAQAAKATAMAPPAAAPPQAVREVQALLEALGYAPGPADGVWGVRTEAAWQAFARDAERLARATVLESAGEPPIFEMPLDEGPTAGPSEPADLAAAVLAAAALESRTPSEAASPSEAPSPAAAPGAAQAGDAPPGLPPQPITLSGTLRGVMGYRMPLVSRQAVPDQVVSGVLIPAHTTFVILRPGYWELVGLDPGDVEYLRGAAARAQAEALAEAHKPEPQPVRRRWTLLDLFRRKGTADDEK